MFSREVSVWNLGLRSRPAVSYSSSISHCAERAPLDGKVTKAMWVLSAYLARCLWANIISSPLGYFLAACWKWHRALLDTPQIMMGSCTLWSMLFTQKAEYMLLAEGLSTRTIWKISLAVYFSTQQ